MSSLLINNFRWKSSNGTIFDELFPALIEINYHNVMLVCLCLINCNAV